MNEYITAVEVCDDYNPDRVREQLCKLIEASGDLSWLKPGMRIGIKLNLCAAMKPETAATTHPVVAAELTRLLVERGAEVVLGDSSAGPFTQSGLKNLYNATGMYLCEAVGGKLNMDTEVTEVDFKEGVVLKKFSFTKWLADCEVVISLCKLKSHGLMGMTAAVKNTYGIIPGTKKSEMHFRYSRPEDFANIMVDLNEYLKPKLYICDAIDCMEGNGPTQGTVRHMGLLLANENPYRLDRVCAALVNVQESEIPYLIAAKQRGLLPEEKPDRQDMIDRFALADFEHSGATSSWFLINPEDGIIKKMLKRTLAALLGSKPALGKGCIGCGHCKKLCPAGAISIHNNKAVIDRKKCVKCFCCQEFCPKGAMIVKRTVVARLLQR